MRNIDLIIFTIVTFNSCTYLEKRKYTSELKEAKVKIFDQTNCSNLEEQIVYSELIKYENGQFDIWNEFQDDLISNTLKEDSNCEVAYEMLADDYFQIANNDSAYYQFMPILKKGRTLFPNNENLNFSIGYICMVLDSTNLALSHFNKAQSIFSKYYKGENHLQNLSYADNLNEILKLDGKKACIKITFNSLNTRPRDYTIYELHRPLASFLYFLYRPKCLKIRGDGVVIYNSRAFGYLNKKIQLPSQVSDSIFQILENFKFANIWEGSIKHWGGKFWRGMRDPGTEFKVDIKTSKINHHFFFWMPSTREYKANELSHVDNKLYQIGTFFFQFTDIIKNTKNRDLNQF